MPEIRTEQLEAQLERGLAPLYVIHGDEPLLALEAADAIRSRARKAGFTERSVFIAERGFKWGELDAAGASMSLFGDKRLIELRIPTGKPGAEGGEALQRHSGTLGPETLTLVSLPRLDRASQGSAWFSALSRAGTVINIHPVERARLPDWIAARLARQKQRASPEALAFLADSVEGNLLAAHQEIQKLALLAPAGEIDIDTMRSAVLDVARYDASQLPEALLSGDAARYARVLEGLRAEGEAPPRVVWLLAEDLRAAARVGEGLAAGRALPDLLRENRVWGDARQRAVGAAARRLSRRTLEDGLVRAARIDRISKGVARGDAWEELFELGLVVTAAFSARSANLPADRRRY